MIIKLQLTGGLGNQMFQYAFGKSLEKKYNCELYFSHQNDGKRKYMLDIFKINEKNINISFDDEIKYYGSFYNDNLSKYDRLDTNKNYLMSGYFQHEHYFSSITNEIKSVFKLDTNIVTDEKSLVVQVRRTDFLNNKNFNVCDKNWYDNAIKLFPNCENIFFVSDDIDWCEKNFKNLNNNLFFLNLNEKETLGFLQKNKNFIISNSSFAWWGVWLSNFEKVIQPKIWFKGDLTWDLGCEKWIRL